MDTDSIASMCGTIIKEAETEAAQIIAQAEKQADQKMRMAEQEIQSRIRKIISQAEAKSDTAVKKLQASVEVEKYTLTMLKQEELITQVMQAVEKKIEAFTASDAYTGYLKSILPETVRGFDSKKVTIQIGKTDPLKKIQAIIDSIQKKDGITCTLDSQRHTMHGVVAYNADKSIRITNTLEECIRLRKDDIRLHIYQQLFGKGA